MQKESITLGYIEKYLYLCRFKENKSLMHPPLDSRIIHSANTQHFKGRHYEMSSLNVSCAVCCDASTKKKFKMVKNNIDIEGQTILVTGAAGFIGSNLVRRLFQ